jgi:hypothetical protein
VEGNYIIEEVCKVLPLYFYDFLKTNLKTKSEFLRRKIVDTDVEKFLKGKLGLTYKDILQHLLKEFCEYIKHFFFKNVDKLPPYQLWDYKIEIMPGKQALYYKNRPLSLAELSCVKKWIDKILDKGFIYELTSLAIALLFLTAKPGGGV